MSEGRVGENLERSTHQLFHDINPGHHLEIQETHKKKSLGEPVTEQQLKLCTSPKCDYYINLP
jgi:hypothetical protein